MSKQSKKILAKETSISDHRIEWESSPRWVRVKFGGEIIANSKRVMLMRETGHQPVYYFPQDDVAMDLLEATTHRTHCPYKGDAVYWSIKVGDKLAENAVWCYPDPLPECIAIKDYLAFYWHKMDAWYEEDEEVFVHPRDPYTRIDTILSSRHVKIMLDGITLADTHQPYLLFETGLPTRYYLPAEDVQLDYLVPSESQSRCPYKGIAAYWSVKLGETVYPDLVWFYPNPTPECPKIKDLLCFYQEKVDLYIDGELQARPKT